jgi:hypothetical protein
VIVVLYLRSPGHREVAREEAGELALPGQGSLLPQMNESFPEFVHAPDVIVVSVSCDRDHPLAGAYEPAEYTGQRSNPGTRVHDQISLRSADVIKFARISESTCGSVISVMPSPAGSKPGSRHRRPTAPHCECYPGWLEDARQPRAVNAAAIIWPVREKSRSLQGAVGPT